MTDIRTYKIAFAAGCVLLGSATVALADPPARVGRLSDVEGAVSFQGDGQTDWSPATLNYPVTTGATFWTQPGARDEIQIGGTEVRMDQATEIKFLRLDDGATQIQMGQGVVNVHVGAMPPGGIAVLTNAGQVDLLAPGSYDIDAGAAVTGGGQLPARLTVLEGDARFDGPRGPVEVQPGETATIVANPFNVSLAEAAPSDFDNWALMREHREAALQSAQYVPPDMTGYQDLDANGQWAPTPDYGPVWYPSAVPAGWAPYRFGHWAFIPPWGWTWVDDARWGFAPFHYGRWAIIGGRWGWCPGVPGAVAVTPVYAPAMVAFIGGGGFGLSLSVGGSMAAVGWVPLAPFEPFHPWYRVSPGYVRNVNVRYVRAGEIDRIGAPGGEVFGHFANHGAAVVVSADAFTHAAPVARAVVSVPAGQLANVRVAADLHEFHATPEARAAFVRPNAIPEHQAEIHASVSAAPVAYHPAPAPAPRPAQTQTQAPAPRPTQAQAEAPRPAQAAGPHPAPAAAPAPLAARPAVRPVQANARPLEVQHPAQQTHLAATPQGWQRQPAPREAAPAPHPEPHHEAAKPDEKDRDKHQ